MAKLEWDSGSEQNDLAACENNDFCIPPCVQENVLSLDGNVRDRSDRFQTNFQL